VLPVVELYYFWSTIFIGDSDTTVVVTYLYRVLEVLAFAFISSRYSRVVITFTKYSEYKPKIRLTCLAPGGGKILHETVRLYNIRYVTFVDKLSATGLGALSKTRTHLSRIVGF
jgi:hypothetical protein